MIYKNLLYIIFLTFSFSQDYPEIGQTESLDVMTWNIENFPKSNQTINYVTNIINDINVDIIALQEITDQNSFNDLVNQLGNEWIGYRADNSNYQELSYLINLDHVEITHYPYTILDDYEYYFAYRPPYVVEVSFNEETFIFINVHYKCCGDGNLEQDDWDEEYRRQQASYYLKNYIDTYLSNQNVIVLGDFNDDISESTNNVFSNFLDDAENYYFADTHIAEGPSSNWSFPNWPSHLDHILITNELFGVEPSSITTLRLDDSILGGWPKYDNYISDHRPVGIKLFMNLLPNR